MAVTTFTTTDTVIEQAHRERLKQLELRAAKQGLSTPPEVLTEIAAIRVVLGEVAAQPEPLTPDQFNAAIFRSVLIVSGRVEEVCDRVEWLAILVIILFLLEPLWARLLE